MTTLRETVEEAILDCLPDELGETGIEDATYAIADAILAIPEIAEALRDVGRMDWLDETGRQFGHGFCHENYGDYTYYVHAYSGLSAYSTARETIDAAIEGEKHE